MFLVFHFCGDTFENVKLPKIVNLCKKHKAFQFAKGFHFCRDTYDNGLIDQIGMFDKSFCENVTLPFLWGHKCNVTFVQYYILKQIFQFCRDTYENVMFYKM